MSSTNTYRQLGLLTGLIASVAIGAAVVLWLWGPGNDYYTVDNDNFGNNATVDDTIADMRSGRKSQGKYGDDPELLFIDRSSDKSIADDKRLTLSGAQLEYTLKLEANLTRRIERLLEPLLGYESIRAQVTADIDFTDREQTQEVYNPDSQILRNNEIEEYVENRKEMIEPGEMNKQRRIVNNYELNKTINRTHSSNGRIEKLSIAVIIDDKLSKGVKGNIIRTPRTNDELETFTDLVKKATGFNAKRGDTVNVIGASFKTRRVSTSGASSPVWGRAWIKEMFNTILGSLLIVMLTFAVIRPAIKSLTNLPTSISASGVRYNENRDDLAINIDGSISDINEPGNYEKNMATVTRVVERDPKLAAQIIKNWVSADGK